MDIPPSIVSQLADLTVNIGSPAIFRGKLSEDGA